MLLLIMVSVQAPLHALAEADGAATEDAAFCDDVGGAGAAASSASEGASKPACRLRQPAPTDRVGPSLLYRLTPRDREDVGSASAGLIFSSRQLKGYHESEQNL